MIRKAKVVVQVLTCDRCGHEWQIPHPKELPKVCVKCKSIKWNAGKKANKTGSV